MFDAFTGADGPAKGRAVRASFSFTCAGAPLFGRFFFGFWWRSIRALLLGDSFYGFGGVFGDPSLQLLGIEFLGTGAKGLPLVASAGAPRGSSGVAACRTSDFST